MTAILPRLGRVDAPGEPCRCPSYPHAHPATYRFEQVDERGITTRFFLCTNRAAFQANRFGLEWPPGFWRTP